MAIDQEFSKLLHPTRDFSHLDTEEEEEAPFDRTKWLEEQYHRHGGDKPRSLWTPFDYHLRRHMSDKSGLAYAISPCIVGTATKSPLREDSSPEDLEAAQKYTEAVLRWAGEKPDNYDLKFLGEGMDGSVFWLSDRKKVLKVTLAEEDAQASALLQRKPNRDLYKIYKVGRIIDGYAIIAEKLLPLSGKETSLWDKVYEELYHSGYHPAYSKGPMSERWLKKLEDKIEAMPEVFEYVQEKLSQIEEWVELFTDRGIFIQDFHSGNIMARGRTEIISDMGRSEIRGGPSIPDIRV